MTWLAAAAVFAALAAMAAGQRALVIHADYKIASYAVKADGSLAGAIDAFGTPSS